MGQSNYRQLGEVIDLVEQMLNQHGDSLAQPVAEIIEGCFREYGLHLDGLESKDIAALKKRIGDLRGMQRNLARDLEGTDSTKAALLRDREQKLLMREEAQERKGEDRIHQMINAAQERLLAHKQQLDSIVAQDQDKLRELAEEMREGKDELYTENTTTVETLYENAKTALERQLDN